MQHAYHLRPIGYFVFSLQGLGFRALLILRCFSFKVLGFVQSDPALYLYPFGRLDFVKLKD
jgi:hypothetical protein